MLGRKYAVMNTLQEVYDNLKRYNPELRMINNDCLMIDLTDTKRVIAYEGKIEINYRRRIYGVDYWDRNYIKCEDFNTLKNELKNLIKITK